MRTFGNIVTNNSYFLIYIKARPFICIQMEMVFIFLQNTNLGRNKYLDISPKKFFYRKVANIYFSCLITTLFAVVFFHMHNVKFVPKYTETQAYCFEIWSHTQYRNTLNTCTYAYTHINILKCTRR